MNSATRDDAVRLPLVDVGAAPRRQLGTLVERSGKGQSPLPLAGVQISARVGDRVAEVSVSQTFVNTHDGPIEVVYIFPLSGGSSLSDFEMTAGGKTIKAVLAEREKARQDYHRALESGRSAALLEQERDDVFTVSLGNLPPGLDATIRLVYSERLPFFDDGRTELRLPLVVAPRYIPGQPLDGESAGSGPHPDTDEVPDASRITPPQLAPGWNPETSLRLDVELHGTASQLTCSQHAVRQTFDTGRTRIELARADELLDRDFVLRWRLADDASAPTLAYYRRGDDDFYGLLSIAAPGETDSSVTGQQRDVVFLLDRSGSMSGAKMASATRACECLLRTLGPSDRFGIAAFDNVSDWFEGDSASRRLTAADEDGTGRGESWLRKIAARGGTEILPALTEALDLFARASEKTRTAVIVLITDGQVGNEGAVLKLIQNADSRIRLFTVGVDSAVNSGLLSNLARIGRGTSVIVEPGAALEDALISIGRDIGLPLVTDLTIEDAGNSSLDATSLAPSRVSDLFEGRATSVSFRTRTPAPIRVRGVRHDGSAYDVVVTGRTIDLPAVAHLWARARITDLQDQYRLQTRRQDTLRTEIVETSIGYRVLSRFTAYLAVNEDEMVKNPSGRRTIVQPVHLPAQWEHPVQMAALAARPGAAFGASRHLGIESAAGLTGSETASGGPDALTLRPGRMLIELGEAVGRDDDWTRETGRLLEDARILLDEREELRSRFDQLVSGLRELATSGDPQLLEKSAPILAKAQTLLKRLQELSERFKDLLNKLQSLSTEPKTSRSRGRLRFWDHG